MKQRLRISPFRAFLTLSPLSAYLLAFVFHFGVIAKYSVNIPFWDDWALVEGNHPAALDADWLYSQFNDHRTTTTKLFVWSLYHLDGWNLRHQLILNFLIYAAAVSFFSWYGSRVQISLPRWTIFGFSIFLLSPMIWLNHVIGCQVAIHLWLFSFLLGAYFLFHNRHSWLYVILGCVAEVFSIYSFGAGVVTSAVTVAGFSVFAWSGRQSDTRRPLSQVVVAVGIVAISIALWFVGWHQTPARLPWVWPYRWKFWSFFLNLVAYGFGIEQVSVVGGTLSLLFVVAPICVIIWRCRGKLTAGQCASLTLVVAVLADLALISLGRAEYGLWSAKFPYYGEHAMLLIVLTAINWSVALAGRRYLQAVVLGGLWVFCFVTFASQWTTANYQKNYAEKMEGRRCVQTYYQKGSFDRGGADARCPTIFPWPGSMEGNLETAKRLRASFYRELTGDK